MELMFHISHFFKVCAQSLLSGSGSRVHSIRMLGRHLLRVSPTMLYIVEVTCFESGRSIQNMFDSPALLVHSILSATYYWRFWM